MQIHTEGPGYDHAAFKPWRLQALAFKAIRRLYPDYPLWRDFPYEYEHGKLAIDVINGGPLLREWVDDAAATPPDLDALAVPDEQAWVREREADVAVLKVTERSPDERSEIRDMLGAWSGIDATALKLASSSSR